MAATGDLDPVGARTPPGHLVGRLALEQVRIDPAQQQDRTGDGVPVAPHAHAVDPARPEGLPDGGVVMRPPAAGRLGEEAVHGDVAPLLVGEGPERAEHDPQARFAGGEVVVQARRVPQPVADMADGRPGQERPDVVDDGRRIGVSCAEASTMPVRPPREVPIQSISPSTRDGR